MNFGDWSEEYVRKDPNLDFDLIILEDMAEAWDASRLNLPTCKTCEHFSLEDSYYSAPMCTNNKSVAKYVHPKFGCKFHSELKKLQSDG